MIRHALLALFLLVLVLLPTAAHAFVWDSCQNAPYYDVFSNGNPPPAGKVFVGLDDGTCISLNTNKEHLDVQAVFGHGTWTRISAVGVGAGTVLWVCANPTMGSTYAPCDDGREVRYTSPGFYWTPGYEYSAMAGTALNLPEAPACTIPAGGVSLTNCGTASDANHANWILRVNGIPVQHAWPGGDAGGPCYYANGINGAPVTLNQVCPPAPF